jgi:hypothetical protein
MLKQSQLIPRKQKTLPQFQNSCGFSYEYKVGQLAARGAVPKRERQCKVLTALEKVLTKPHTTRIQFP